MNESKKKNSWKCIFRCTFSLLLAISLLFMGMGQLTAYAAKNVREEILGTSALDIKNVNITAMDEDGTLYYKYKGGLYKQKTSSKGWSKFKPEKGKCLVSGCVPGCISVIDDDVYYISSSDNNAYRISKDGGKPKCIVPITHGTLAGLYVSQSYYFVYVVADDSEESGLIRVGHSGEAENAILIKSPKQFAFLDGYIYYVQEENGKDVIYRLPMDWDGEESKVRQKIRGLTKSEAYVEEICTDEDYLYLLCNYPKNETVSNVNIYTDDNDRIHTIYRIDPISNEVDNRMFKYPSEVYSNIRASDGCIYYLDLNYLSSANDAYLYVHSLSFEDGKINLIYTKSYKMDEALAFSGIAGLDSGYLELYSTDFTADGNYFYLMNPDGSDAETYKDDMNY